jgi:hypothetical protein
VQPRWRGLETEGDFAMAVWTFVTQADQAERREQGFDLPGCFFACDRQVEGSARESVAVVTVNDQLCSVVWVGGAGAAVEASIPRRAITQHRQAAASDRHGRSTQLVMALV